jgi:transaldolase
MDRKGKKMKLFLDTADRELIKQWMPTGLIDGVTTNPTHLSKEGPNSREVLLDICQIVKDGDVSIEVVEKEPEAVYKQAREIASLAPNVVVKIPCVKEYLPVIHRLVQEEIRLNITLVFSLAQVLLMAKLNVAYISPFVGRIEDIGYDGIELIDQAVEIVNQYDFESEILAASLRSVQHLQQVAVLGADVATVPPSLLDTIMAHPLTEKGIKKFDDDWKKLGKVNLLG